MVAEENPTNYLDKSERLQMYTDLITIDNIVIRSHGAYTHDDVWFLNVVTVMNLTLLHYEQDMLQQRRHSINQQLKQK